MSVLAQLKHLLRRSGVSPARARQSIWIHGDGIDGFEAASGLIRGLRRARPSSSLAFTTGDLAAAEWLRERYPGHHAGPPPAGLGLTTRLFLLALDPVMLLWLGFRESLPLAALRAAHRRGLPIAVVDGELPSRLDTLRHAVPLVRHFSVRAAGTAARLRAEGATSVRVAGPLADERPDPQGRLPTLDALAALLDGLPPPIEGDFHDRRRVRQLATTRPGRWLASTRTTRRLPDWEALRRRLGSPRTILCLGNGPSSEDPAVRAVPHDCLMRVNHRWRDRGILTRPDMVFVGDLRTTLEISGCVFGFRVIVKEREVLLRHLLLGRRLDQLEHFTLERVPSLLDDLAWPANPTSGAVMIATAVMLQPERLVIAGIDLFQDPRGSYPGAPLAENEYLPGHDREADLAVIEHALGQYAGELVQLAPCLEATLRQRRARGAAAATPPTATAAARIGTDPPAALPHGVAPLGSAPMSDIPAVQHRFVQANGLRFHVAECGTGDRLALCLHGFPECWYSWRAQLPLLARLGYRAWAPDLRGYGETDRPSGMDDYQIEKLMDDVAGLIDAAAPRETVLLAHDWGAVVAWWFAIRRLRPLDRLVVMNLPHPAPFERELRTWKQLRRSWYAFVFQLPRLPEALLRANDYRAIREAFRGSAIDKSRFPDEVLQVYRDSAARPGALTAMLNYYRAVGRGGGGTRQRQLGFGHIDTPTLLLWGEEDVALCKETTYGTEQWVSDLTLRYLPGVSHWVQQEAPETVNAMLEAWLTGQPVPEAPAARRLVA